MYHLIDFCCICFSNSGLLPLTTADSDNITLYGKLTSYFPEMNCKEITSLRMACKKCCHTIDSIYQFRKTCVMSKKIFANYVGQLQTNSKTKGNLSINLTDFQKQNENIKNEVIEIDDITEYDSSSDPIAQNNESASQNTTNVPQKKLNDGLASQNSPQKSRRPLKMTQKKFRFRNELKNSRRIGPKSRMLKNRPKNNPPETVVSEIFEPSLRAIDESQFENFVKNVSINIKETVLSSDDEAENSRSSSCDGSKNSRVENDVEVDPLSQLPNPRKEFRSSNEKFLSKKIFARNVLSSQNVPQNESLLDHTYVRYPEERLNNDYSKKQTKFWKAQNKFLRIQNWAEKKETTKLTKREAYKKMKNAIQRARYEYRKFTQTGFTARRDTASTQNEPSAPNNLTITQNKIIGSSDVITSTQNVLSTSQNGFPNVQKMLPGTKFQILSLQLKILGPEGENTSSKNNTASPQIQLKIVNPQNNIPSAPKRLPTPQNVINPQNQILNPQSALIPQNQVSRPSSGTSSPQIEIVNPQNQISKPNSGTSSSQIEIVNAQNQILNPQNVLVPQNQVSRPSSGTSSPQIEIVNSQNQISRLNSGTWNPQNEISLPRNEMGVEKGAQNEISFPRDDIFGPDNTILSPHSETLSAQNEIATSNEVLGAQKDVLRAQNDDLRPQSDAFSPLNEILNPGSEISSQSKVMSTQNELSSTESGIFDSLNGNLGSKNLVGTKVERILANGDEFGSNLTNELNTEIDIDVKEEVTIKTEPEIDDSSQDVSVTVDVNEIKSEIESEEQVSEPVSDFSQLNLGTNDIISMEIQHSDTSTPVYSNALTQFQNVAASTSQLNDTNAPLVKKKRIRPSCPYCNRSFDKYHYLELHKRKHFGEQTHKCKKCVLTFTDQKSYREHAKSHRSPKPIKCDMCDKTFAHPCVLKSHRKVHFKVRFPCTICQKSFKAEDGLEKHMMKHNKYTNRPFKCNECPKAYTKKSYLQSHLKTHGGRTNMCDVCGKMYPDLSTLNKHLRGVHSVYAQVRRTKKVKST